jgi:hypothetical protein
MSTSTLSGTSTWYFSQVCDGIGETPAGPNVVVGKNET